MKTKLLKASCAAGAVCALLAGTAAQAGTVSSIVGEQDNFKLDPSLVLVDGATFDSFGLNYFDPVFDPLVTDLIAAVGDAGVTAIQTRHSYVFSGAIQSASLELLSAGWGFYGLAQAFVNGIYVGDLSDGDEFDATTDTYTEFVRKDVFDLTSKLGVLNLSGNDTVEIRTVTGDILDYGVLDYARLTIVTDSLEVPEPATGALVAAALAAAALLRRRPRG